MRAFEPDPNRDPGLFRPIEEPRRGAALLAGALAVVVVGALALYLRQLRLGLQVTGMMQPVTWGFYVV